MYESETGFYYLGSRYYDPETGRFINADEFLAIVNDITGMNRFAYCGNNPIMYKEPSVKIFITAFVSAESSVIYSTAVIIYVAVKRNMELKEKLFHGE